MERANRQDSSACESGSANDGVTVITAATPRGMRLESKYYVKGWTTQGQIHLPKPYLHNVKVVSVDDIWDLSEILTDLEEDPQSCVIRGIPKDKVIAPCRRQAINFTDRGHYWVCFDFDSIPGRLTPQQVVWRCLPDEFHDASFHWQYSASHGFKDGTRMHCWFWMDRPVTSPEWLRWLASHGVDDSGEPKVPIDPALYRVVQPHITAKPFLIDVPDPAPIRSGTVKRGVDRVPFRYGPHPIELPRPKDIQTQSPSPPDEWRARQTGVIGAFNRRFAVTEVLEWYGYQRFGNRFLHPQSSSLVPDTVINSGTHAYAFSPNNPLRSQDIDRGIGEGTRNRDAFDCFRILGFQGDEARAVAAASRLLAGGAAKAALEIASPYPEPQYETPEAASAALGACIDQFIAQEASSYWEGRAQGQAANSDGEAEEVAA